MAAFPMAPGRSAVPPARAHAAPSNPASVGHKPSARGTDTGNTAGAALDEFNSDLGAARVTIAHLARWAMRYVLLSKTEAEGGCLQDQHHCTLSALPGGAQACRLARDLAWMAADQGIDAQPRLGLDLEAVAARYLQALGDAATAVAYCQAVQHHIASCWFASSASDDLCSRTLTLAERVKTR